MGVSQAAYVLHSDQKKRCFMFRLLNNCSNFMWSSNSQINKWLDSP